MTWWSREREGDEERERERDAPMAVIQASRRTQEITILLQWSRTTIAPSAVDLSVAAAASEQLMSINCNATCAYYTFAHHRLLSHVFIWDYGEILTRCIGEQAGRAEV